MDTTFLDVYIVISIAIAAVDVLLAVKSFQKNRSSGKFLAYACLGAAVVDVSYLVSILSNDYFCVSAMSSVYFVNIDFMLICLLIFTVHFTRGKFSKNGKRALTFAIAFALFEAVVFAINPFHEIAIHYVLRDTFIAKYSYQMEPLYWMHLVFTYTMVAVVLTLLLRTICRIPHEYRSQYIFVVLGIVAIVGVNAIFLFEPSVSIYNLLDYSICGYSLTAFLLYWSCFEYSTHGMLNKLKTSIFDNIGQGIVLFDYHDQMILHNERANHLLGAPKLDACFELSRFLKHFGIDANPLPDNGMMSLQCYVKDGDQVRPLRCDVRSLKNGRGQRLGQLFVFSDAELETDLLTEFQSWDSFRVLVRDQKNAFPCPTAVAICDINSLSVINSTLGNHIGDQRIRNLADLMRSNLPKQAYFVRGTEARLIALCSHRSEAELLECLKRVQEQSPGKVQYAVSVSTPAMPDVIDVIGEAEKALRAKKLLDHESVHSEMLTSLIRALQECDQDTEHHVRRTRAMGEKLGNRIELTDVEQSKLSLLCLLHDIGKIGIPLEILNKPGALSAEEKAILRSHVQKGYDIANSSNELKDIAEEILHHHERWDGSGYPDGLSGESIPLLSRVIAVVDAYDAMTHDRSYRKAIPVDRAMEELRRCAGSQFDPYLVSAFLDCLREDACDTNRTDGADGAATAGAVAQSTDTAQPDAGSNAGMRAGNGTDGADGTSGTDGIGVHSIPYSRYLLDESMHIVSVDENFERITGYSPEDVRANKMAQIDLIPAEDRMEYLCHTNAALSKTPMAYQEHKIRRKDGRVIYVLCCGRLYYDSAVRAERSEIVIADVTDTYSVRKIAEAEQNKAQVRLRQWERTYRRDSLTGLLNHAAFRSDVELRRLEGSSRVMMIMMDIDKFKDFNDTRGHHEGDKFLVLVGQAILASLKADDHACRMGGDEFAVALYFGLDATDDQMAERAQQIFDTVNLTVKTVECGAGISMGMAVSRPEMSFNELYEAADRALYEAKRTGRGRLAGGAQG